MVGDQPRRAPRRRLSDPEKLQLLQGAEPQDAACRSELDTFDQLAGHRTRKEIRIKAARICDGCALRTKCAFRMVMINKKRRNMSEVSDRVQKFIDAWKARDKRIAHLTVGMEAKPSTVVDVIVEDDETEAVLLFSDLEDLLSAYSLVTQVRAKDEIPRSSRTDESGS